jgi:hypothetical protein
MSIVKHPQSAGQTEKLNSVLEDILRHCVGPYKTDWDEYLAMVEFAIDNAWKQSIDNTPIMLNCAPRGQNSDTPEVVDFHTIVVLHIKYCNNYCLFSLSWRFWKVQYIGRMNLKRPTANKGTLNHAKTSFSTEIFAGAIISVVQSGAVTIV